MPDSYEQLKAEWDRINAKDTAVIRAGVRAAFRAGFMAHPEAEADREEAAWEAYRASTTEDK